MPVDTSMYPTKPAVDPVTGAASTINLLNSIQQNRMLNTQNNMLSAQYGANQAQGAAAQGAINPDGSYNAAGYNSAIAANPAAAYGAPQAIAANAALQGQGISNTANQNAVNASQDQNYATRLAALPPNSTSKDVSNLIGNMTSEGLLSQPLSHSLYLEVAANGSNIPAYITRRATSAMPASAQLSQTAVGVNPDGSPKMGSTAEAIRQGNQPAGYTTTLPTGGPELIKANQDAFLADQASSAQKLADMRPIQKALPIAEQLNASDFGPNSDGFSRVKQAAITAGIIPQNSPIANQTDLRLELNKYLHQNAGGFTRSDSDLNQKAVSNPNLDLTQGANLALMKNQIGMNRMDATAPIAFQKNNPSIKNGQGYLEYKTGYNQSNDPRAFGADNMNPAERTALAKSLGPRTFDAHGRPTNPAYEKYNNSVIAAEKAGLYNTPGQQQ